MAIAIVFLLLPAALLWLIRHQSWASKLGPIVLCYGLGLLLGNTGLVSASATPAISSLTEISVALALPMLLFSLDIRSWSKSAGKALLSLVFSTTAVVTVSTTLFWLTAVDDPTKGSHLAAMSVGVYTGGTVNLAAIKQGLAIPNELYILFHSLDTLIGGVYLLLMVSVAIPFFRRILVAHPAPSEHSNGSRGSQLHSSPHDEDYSVLLDKGNARQVGQVLLIGLCVVGVSVAATHWLSEILNTQNSSVITIFLLTSFGILLSLWPKVRSLYLSYKLGMYLIYVFCIAVASMARFDSLSQLDVDVAIYLFGTILGSLFLHALLCRIAKIDSDTFMVTSVSAICSPPFVPMMAKALGNPHVLLSGMTTGIIGFALGNYLGVTLALILQALH